MINKLAAAPNLAPDYYVKNFRFLLEWVDERYHDLLTAQERNFINVFRQLEHQAQCLLVRLSSRKGPLFRRDKLKYSEIICIDKAAEQLVQTGLLHTDTAHDLPTLAAALTKPEILTLFAEALSGQRQARKNVLIEKLATTFSTARSWQQWTNNIFGTAWHLDNEAIIRTLHLLFFGNTNQDLTQFVLQDLGLFRYERYIIDEKHRLFKSRVELEQYQCLINLREQLNGDCSVPMLIEFAAQLPAYCDSEPVRRRRAKVCNKLAYAFERAGEYARALELYAQSHLPPARERRIRLMEKHGELAQAWALLTQLLEQPLDEQELQIAQRMAKRIGKKLGTAISHSPAAAITSQYYELRRLLDAENKALRVEETVRLTLNSPSAPCVYAENALLSSLFGLWLWPEMFRSIEGTFAHPFQTAPLDMYQENFVINRPGIAALWESLENGRYRTNISNTWQEKYGIANDFIHWSFITANLLEMALHCIPAEHLKLIFKRLLFDMKNNRSGLPDLIQFFPEQQNYRMIEVKGPNDRLQDNQRRWLEYFAQHQIPVEVFYVRWK
ncbi:MAG TPA: VRR-NUC domain-containing protein [Cellvibrionaceae bacterium]